MVRDYSGMRISIPARSLVSIKNVGRPSILAPISYNTSEFIQVRSLMHVKTVLKPQPKLTTD